jgi:hypothetical protein
MMSGPLSFEIVYREAQYDILADTPDQPAPEGYQNDLRIFAMTAEDSTLPEVRRLSGPAIQELFVHWNAKLGKLQANVIRSLPLTARAAATVADDPVLSNYLRQYFNVLRANKTVSNKLIDEHERRQLEAPLNRATFLVFTDPLSHDLRAMLRIFDGRPLKFLEAGLNAQERPGAEKTDIETDFPHVVFPEREQGLPVYETGRLFASPEVRANSFDQIMGRAADYFSNTNCEGTIYMDGNEISTTYNRRKGATVVYTPDQLHLEAGETPIWILKVGVDQFIQQYTQPEYRSVLPREPSNPAPADG